MKGLHDPPSIHSSLKTTIKNGEIVRKRVYTDTMGNEYKKVGDKYVPKHNPFLGRDMFTFQMPANAITPQQLAAENAENSSGWSDEDVIFLFIYLGIISIVLSILFTIWSVYTSTRNRRQVVTAPPAKAATPPVKA